MIFERRGGLFVGRFRSLMGEERLLHGLSTRKGGISEAPFHSLNLGTKTQDDPRSIGENRRRFLQALGPDLWDPAVPEQVHGSAVHAVDRGGSFPETDGLVTDTPGVLLTLLVADCLPVFLLDPKQKAIGLIHAGWRGTRDGIAAGALGLMISEFGCRPQDVRAFIGPGIGPCCYRVEPDTASQFDPRHVRGGRLDLRGANRELLIKQGIKQGSITVSGLCTACHTNLFFSHRAEGGRTGRMMAVFGLKKSR
ncbi:MAG: peptidoglycan editing factor PgeF [Acidobacteria bacterium]|nr:peptidoglycan editing factor PgeF [Acidobacteriota bacterium]